MAFQVFVCSVCSLRFSLTFVTVKKLHSKKFKEALHIQKGPKFRRDERSSWKNFQNYRFNEVNLHSVVQASAILYEGESTMLALHEKSYFLFPKVLQRRPSQKELHWNTIFLVLSGKMIFPFSENMILFLRRKMKDSLSQKKT